MPPLANPEWLSGLALRRERYFRLSEIVEVLLPALDNKVGKKTRIDHKQNTDAKQRAEYQ
jgi:hypothetical protein